MKTPTKEEHKHIKPNCKLCNSMWKAGVEDGKKEALEDELEFLETLPQQSGKASIFQRTKVKKRITEIKQRLEELSK